MHSSFKTNMTQMPKPTLFSVQIYIVVKTEKALTFSYKILNSYKKLIFLSFELVKSEGVLRYFNNIIQPPSGQMVIGIKES